MIDRDDVVLRISVGVSVGISGGFDENLFRVNTCCARPLSCNNGHSHNINLYQYKKLFYIKHGHASRKYKIK